MDEESPRDDRVGRDETVRTGSDEEDADAGDDGSATGSDDGRATDPPRDRSTDPTASDAAAGETDGEVRDGDPEDDPDEDDPDGSVAGEFVPKGPIEPQSPRLENAVFVVTGAFLTVLAFAGLVSPEAFSLRGIAALVGVTLVVTLVSFAFFGVLNPDT